MSISSLCQRFLWIFGLSIALGTGFSHIVQARQATQAEIQRANRALWTVHNSSVYREQALARHLPWGVPVPLPGQHDNEYLLFQQDYIINYDADLRIPLWVAYCLESTMLARGADVDDNRVEAFRADPRLAAMGLLAVGPRDYASTGFDRGHMAPNADFMFGLVPMINTYIMTNMCPQYPEFNRGIWSYVESYVRRWARHYQRLWLITGAIFDSNNDGQRDPDNWARRMGPKNVAVPTHYFKALMRRNENGQLAMLAIVLPHSPSPLEGAAKQQAIQEGLTSVDYIEQLTAFNLWAGLPDTLERALESEAAPLWP